MGKYFLHVPSPKSLHNQLEDLKNTNPRIYNAVKYFLEVSLPKIRQHVRELYIDDTTTKHFVIRYKRQGIIGIYPTGKLVCLSVNEFVNIFGKRIEEAAIKFRDIVKNEIGTIKEPKDGDRIAEALVCFISEIIRLKE